MYTETGDRTTNTREKVLRTLLSRQRCTINELAEAVDINPISVRHHITKLEAEGLVASEEERHGVGRPRRLYFLTETGLERFPSRYLRLTIRLLEQLKGTMPEPMVSGLFSQMARDVAAEYEMKTHGLNMEQRLDLVTNLLSSEGFTVEWESKDEEYHIREISCPYYHIGQSHPEVCSVDQTLISTMLSVPAEKVKCVLNGDSHCTYVVPKQSTLENQE
ncbi:MAG TPA: winged helix-turn-helix transcriptional regulator [Anaerolineales bacterium]|nr:winged helix-turn-helix transcriptional regulator [Anaerolineales bacterium]